MEQLEARLAERRRNHRSGEVPEKAQAETDIESRNLVLNIGALRRPILADEEESSSLSRNEAEFLDLSIAYYGRYAFADVQPFEL